MSDQILPSRVKNLTHQKFGDLLVLHFVKIRENSNGRREALWLCLCDCGNQVVRSNCQLQRLGLKTCNNCPPESKILQNVTLTESGCWEWRKYRNADGYGKVKYRGISVSSHIVSYQLFVGPTNDLCVLHTCDNPPCCNPFHLFLGTPADNLRDMTEKGRRAKFKGEINPSAKLTDEMVLAIRERYALGKIRQIDIAREFNVSKTAIRYIVRRLTWNHIPEPSSE